VTQEIQQPQQMEYGHGYPEKIKVEVKIWAPIDMHKLNELIQGLQRIRGFDFIIEVKFKI
jgi:hypothetical protein